MTTGHNWLHENLGVIPKISWSIDAFGHSSGVPYLLSHMKFDAMVINRVHKEVKTKLREQKSLEFIWRQNWVGSEEEHSETDMMTHMFPFPLYDIPNTCGPNWDLCAEFDFERPVAKPITTQNVRERAQALLGQYREKAAHFKHNNVLIPLGDDFKYKTLDMTNKIFSQYQLLFDEMNSVSEWKVNIRFSNLSDYFKSVSESQQKKKFDFPILQGDFFTYNDQGDDYWSGYFTTRSFMKGLTRRATSTLNSAQTMFVLASSLLTLPKSETDSLVRKMDESRRSISLFQHHDGITGTARRAVVQDYANMLWVAHRESDSVMKHLLSSLYNSAISKEASENAYTISIDSFKASFEPIEPMGNPVANPLKLPVSNSQSTLIPISLFNPSLSPARKEIVTIVVNGGSCLEILDGNMERIAIQITPLLDHKSNVISNSYEVSFIGNTELAGIYTYFLRFLDSSNADDKAYCDAVSATSSSIGSQEEQISNDLITLKIKGGLISKLNHKPVSVKGGGGGGIGKEYEIQQSLGFYKSMRSGAYLFVPYGEAETWAQMPEKCILLKGALFQRVACYFADVFAQSITLYQPPVTLSMRRIVDIGIRTDLTSSRFDNHELIWKLASNSLTSSQFWTDSNGLEMVKRQTYPQWPVQANYYPTTSAASLTSTDARLTILTSQGFGCANPKEGILELMIDRRLSQDDGRGLGEPVQDNVANQHSIWLVIEDELNAPKESLTLPYSLLLSGLAVNKMSPLRSFWWTKPIDSSSSFFTALSKQANVFNPANSLVSIQSGQAIAPVATLFHVVSANDFVVRLLIPYPLVKDGLNVGSKIILEDLFRNSSLKDVQEASASLVYDEEDPKEHHLPFHSAKKSKPLFAKTSPFVIDRGSDSENKAEFENEFPFTLTMAPMQINTIRFGMMPASEEKLERQKQHESESSSNKQTNKPAKSTPTIEKDNNKPTKPKNAPKKQDNWSPANPTTSKAPTTTKSPTTTTPTTKSPATTNTPSKTPKATSPTVDEKAVEEDLNLDPPNDGKGNGNVGKKSFKSKTPKNSNRKNQLPNEQGNDQFVSPSLTFLFMTTLIVFGFGMLVLVPRWRRSIFRMIFCQ